MIKTVNLRGKRKVLQDLIKIMIQIIIFPIMKIKEMKMGIMKGEEAEVEVEEEEDLEEVIEVEEVEEE